MTQERRFDLSNLSVFIAIPCYSGVVPIEQSRALAQTSVALYKAGVTTYINSERENGVITSVRDRLLTKFLESGAEYMFWIDDDIIFEVNDFMTVLALATEKKMVAASYPTRNDAQVFYIKPVGDSLQIDEYGLIKAKGVGLGFTCIHRDVLETLVKDKPTYEQEGNFLAREVFHVGMYRGERGGEDMHFFKELYDIGFPVFINPNIKLKHVGRKDYSADLKLKEI